jgi:hypothetical protein
VNKTDGAQKMRHIVLIGEFSSTTQRGISLAQPITQRFPDNHNPGIEFPDVRCQDFQHDTK